MNELEGLESISIYVVDSFMEGVEFLRNLELFFEILEIWLLSFNIGE